MDKKVHRRAKTRPRPDGEGKHARRRNKKVQDFTHSFIHKSTLLRTELHLKGGLICEKFLRGRASFVVASWPAPLTDSLNGLVHMQHTVYSTFQNQ